MTSAGSTRRSQVRTKQTRQPKAKPTRRGQSVTLASYTIRIRAKRDTQFRPLGAFDGKTSFYDFALEFLRELERRHGHDELGMSMQRTTKLTEDGDSIWGLLEAGDYGYASELVKVSTMERSYLRETDDAELLPFYFLLNVPEKTDKGILIVQRYGNRGVYTEFTTALRRSFEESHGEYILDIRRHVPAAVIEMLMQGQVKTIQLTSYSLSADLADRIRWKGNRTDVSEVVITIKAKRKGTLARPIWLDHMLKSKSNLNEIPDSLAEIASKVRVEVSYNGKKRYVDFESQDKIAPYLDVTSDIKFGVNGHPTFDSIHTVSSDLLVDLSAEIGRPE